MELEFQKQSISFILKLFSSISFGIGIGPRSCIGDDFSIIIVVGSSCTGSPCLADGRVVVVGLCHRDVAVR